MENEALAGTDDRLLQERTIIIGRDVRLFAACEVVPRVRPMLDFGEPEERSICDVQGPYERKTCLGREA